MYMEARVKSAQITFATMRPRSTGSPSTKFLVAERVASPSTSRMVPKVISAAMQPNCECAPRCGCAGRLGPSLVMQPANHLRVRLSHERDVLPAPVLRVVSVNGPPVAPGTSGSIRVRKTAMWH